MIKNILKIALGCGLLIAPCHSFAEVVTIEKINVEIQPLQNNEFQIFITFDLPVLPKAANIDHVVLSLGLNVLAKSETMLFEVLSKENAGRAKVVNYNANPVTARISRNKAGLTQLDLDITQLVELWVKEGEKNEGFILISHRNIQDKFLTSTKIALAPEFKTPTVKIFYTVFD